MKYKGNESTGRCADWGNIDLEFWKSNCISGMGGPIVMERCFQSDLLERMHCCLDLNTSIFFHVYVYKNVLRPVKWRPFKSGFYVITDILHVHKWLHIGRDVKSEMNDIKTLFNQSYKPFICVQGRIRSLYQSKLYFINVALWYNLTSIWIPIMDIRGFCNSLNTHNPNSFAGVW